MVKQYCGVWLPDREKYLQQDIDVSEPYAGAGTVQFKKYNFAKDLIKRYRHAIDIGANLGLWARVLANDFERVTCFEPSSECYEAFWLNIGALRDKVTLHECALSNAAGTLTLNNTLMSTAFTQVAKDGITVPCQTLDSFQLQDVDFIKIDVEGWEWFVLQGAVQTLQRYKPILILEQKPNNAERYGKKQFAAAKFLNSLGAREVLDYGGDVIMRW